MNHYRIFILLILIIMSTGCINPHEQDVIGLEFLEDSNSHVRVELHYFAHSTNANRFYSNRGIEDYLILWVSDGENVIPEKSEQWIDSLSDKEDFQAEYAISNIQESDSKMGVEFSFFGKPHEEKTANDLFLEFFEDNLVRVN